MPRTRTRTAQRKWAWLAILVLVIGVAIFATWKFAHLHSSGAFDAWLQQEGFEPQRPTGADFPPGTLLFVSGSSDYVALSAHDFVGEKSDWVQAGARRKLTLEVSGSAKAQGEMHQGAVTGGKTDSEGAGSANLVLEGVRTLTLPLNHIGDLTRDSARVTQALRRSPDSLFVVTDTMVADSAEIRYSNRTQSASAIQSHLNSLRQQFGFQFSTNQSGSIVAAGPIVLGVRLAQLSAASRALGGGDSTIKVEAFRPQQIASFRRTRAAYLAPLWSGYDVHALVIGLGNYAEFSDRVGGKLPGAVASAELVATDLRRLIGVGQQNNVTLITSTLGADSGFDPTERLRRDDLQSRIEHWVSDTKAQTDPKKRSLILFYYFGHGLAEGMSRSVFLVPEQFNDDPNRRVDQMQDRLISLEWVIRTLKQGSDQLVLVIDACREHKQDDQELVQKFPGTQTQKGNLADILAAVQFANGSQGPYPVLFGSEDGTNAAVVDYPTAHLQGIGPLARRLDEVFASVAGDLGPRTLKDFVKDMTSGGETHGFTSLRQDFADALGNVVFLDPKPRSPDLRAQAWVSPYQEIESIAGTEPKWPKPPPAVVSKMLCELGDAEINQMVLDSTHHRLFVADESWRVFSCPEKGGPLQRIDYPTGDGSFPVIGRVGKDSMVAYSADERRNYEYRANRFVPTDRAAFPRMVGASYRGEPIAIGFTFNDTAARRFLRYRASRWVESEYKPPPANDEVLGLVEPQAKVLYYSLPNGLWRATANGGASLLTAPLWRPTTLTCSESGDVFVLSSNGRALYRVTPSGKVSWVDLFKAGISDAYVAKSNATGLATEDGKSFYVGVGRWVVRVEPPVTSWRPLS